MKKDLYDIFDDLTPQETSGLLEGIEGKDTPGLDPDQIAGKVLAKAGAEKRGERPFWRRSAAVAASLLLILGAAFGVRAYALDVKEYNEAVEFFNENALSTEGLTRAEIKAVYRDITTGVFSFEKTAQVIETSLSVSGYEIFQEEPTPEEVEALWNHRAYNYAYNYSTGYWVETVPEDRVSYRFEGFYEGDPADGSFTVTVVKTVGGETVWSVTIPEYWGETIQPATGGVLVYGYTPIEKHVGDAIVRSKSYGWLAKISEDGQLLWHRQLTGGFKDEYICSLVENDDGSYAVFSRGDLNYLCLYQYSADGDLLLSKSTEIGNYGIQNAAWLGDGYLVQLMSYNTGEYAKLVKLDPSGNLTDAFSYESEDSTYHVTDMVEFDGRVYLSAYAVPKQEQGGFHGEIGPVLEQIWATLSDYDPGEYGMDYPTDKLTQMVRDNYTALLLVCDPEGGEPRKFYAVKGSLGGNLALGENGDLLWSVESITSTFFSPATSSFSIGGTSTVYRYAFAPGGALISREKTGEMAGFHR